jgi:hypothetical protein
MIYLHDMSANERLVVQSSEFMSECRFFLSLGAQGTGQQSYLLCVSARPGWLRRLRSIAAIHSKLNSIACPYVAYRRRCVLISSAVLIVSFRSTPMLEKAKNVSTPVPMRNARMSGSCTTSKLKMPPANTC